MSAFRDLLSFISNQTRRPAEFLVLIGAMVSIFAVGVLDAKSLQAQLVVMLGITTAAAGVSMIMLSYLQQTRKRLRSAADHRSVTDLRRLQDEITKLKAQTANVANLTVEERQKVLADVTANLSKTRLPK